MKLTRKPFYFMRHGQTDWNVQGKTAGNEPVPLNEIGTRQAESVQDLLPTLAISHVYYSPTLRAHQTEQLATKKLSCPKTPVDDLKEWDYGDFIGKAKDAYLRAHYKTVEIPHGETKEHFFNRVTDAVHDALAHAESPLIIAHLGNYWALADAMGLEALYVENCQVVRFTPIHKSWQQELLNWL